MSCKITTGKRVLTQPKTAGKAPEAVTTSFVFDKNSTNKISRPIHVDECMAVKLSTFNLPDGANLTLHRVILGGGIMPQSSGCMCGGDKGQEAYALFSEVFKIDCKPVVIDNCDGALFLTVPGTYMLELNDEAVLGSFVALAERVDCCCLPDGLIIGNAKPDTYVGTK